MCESREQCQNFTQDKLSPLNSLEFFNNFESCLQNQNLNLAFKFLNVWFNFHLLSLSLFSRSIITTEKKSNESCFEGKCATSSNPMTRFLAKTKSSKFPVYRDVLISKTAWWDIVRVSARAGAGLCMCRTHWGKHALMSVSTETSPISFNENCVWDLDIALMAVNTTQKCQAALLLGVNPYVTFQLSALFPSIAGRVADLKYSWLMNNGQFLVSQSSHTDECFW